MSTYRDIRAKFQAAMINEGRKNLPYSQDLAKEVRDLLLKNKIRGNKTQNLSELRFGISGDPQQTAIWIAATIFPNIKGDDYILTYEGPDRAKKGEAKSGIEKHISSIERESNRTRSIQKRYYRHCYNT